MTVLHRGSPGTSLSETAMGSDSCCGRGSGRFDRSSYVRVRPLQGAHERVTKIFRKQAVNVEGD